MRLGDVIVIGIDMNEDVRTVKLTQRLKALGLRELILSTHSEASPPATFIRNNSRNSSDGLLETKTVELFQSGYLPVKAAGAPTALIDGHRLILAEVCNQSIIGEKMPHSTKAIQTKVLKANDFGYKKKL